MSHNYTVSLKFSEMGALPSFRGCGLELYNISDINVDLWNRVIVIEYYEKDDEVGFVRAIARFINMMNNVRTAADDAVIIDAIDWDGLEDYIDETNWTDELYVLPHKGKTLISVENKTRV